MLALLTSAVLGPFIALGARLLAATGWVLAAWSTRAPGWILLLSMLLGALAAQRQTQVFEAAQQWSSKKLYAHIEIIDQLRRSQDHVVWMGAPGLSPVRARLRGLPPDAVPGSRWRAQVQTARLRGRRNPDDRDPRRGALARRCVVWGRAYRPQLLRPNPTGPAVSRLKASIERHLAKDLGGSWPLWRALLLGDSSDLEPRARSLFQRLGLAHLLALSGLHVGMVLAIVLWPLRRWGRRALLPALLPVLAWAWLAGMGPSLVRALAMALWVGVGRLLARPTAPWDALGLVALMELVARPHVLGGLGWWLSYAATAALLRALPGLRSLPRIVSAFVLSVAAQLGTAPWVLSAFGHWPWCSAVLLLLVAPPFAVLLGLGIVLSGIAICVPLLAGPALSLLAAVTHLFGLLLQVLHRWSPGPLPHPGISGWQWAVAMTVLALGLPWPRPRATARLLLAGAGVLLAHVSVLREPVHRWVSFDVGQGDAGIYRHRARSIIVDAGPRWREYDAGARVILPYLERRALWNVDLVLSHGHLDHIGGAWSLLRSGRVARLWMARCDSTQEWTRELAHLARENAAAVHWLAAGDTLGSHPPFVTCLWPPPKLELTDQNDRSIVLRLGPGAAGLLATGDLEHSAEKRLSSATPKIAILKVAHHGGDTGSSMRFLEATAGRWALISCGEANRYGHPHPATLERLDSVDLEVLRTDELGALMVHWSTNGSARVGGLRAPP